jgi:hypothetical protein
MGCLKLEMREKQRGILTSILSFNLNNIWFNDSCIYLL